jgi:hypothetical protein
VVDTDSTLITYDPICYRVPAPVPPLIVDIYGNSIPNPYLLCFLHITILDGHKYYTLEVYTKSILGSGSGLFRGIDVINYSPAFVTGIVELIDKAYVVRITPDDTLVYETDPPVAH